MRTRSYVIISGFFSVLAIIDLFLCALITGIFIYMRKSILFLWAVSLTCCAWAQDNMEAFRHLSIGGELGLHGVGVELAMPVQKHLVFKAGYNQALPGDLLSTDMPFDTKDLREAQEQYSTLTGYEFKNKFEDESVINAGIRMGLTNLKAMVNWYPFSTGRFYVAGGVYYTPRKAQDDPFLKISGNTTENDWAALQELNEKYPDVTAPGGKRELAMEIGDEKYPVIENEGKGFMQADFRIDPLKYYLGIGLGRCVPNKTIGLQLEAGALIYHNATLYCQDKEVGSLMDAADVLGDDTKEIIEYVDKYPIYPQLTLRISFRLF